jgi:hypothetical protein
MAPVLSKVTNFALESSFIHAILQVGTMCINGGNIDENNKCNCASTFRVLDTSRAA